MCMCCLTIETDVMLANFFGSPKYEELGENVATINNIEKCAKILANNLPGYVFYDLTPKKIESLIKEDRNYAYGDDGRIIYRGEKIDRKSYNMIYTQEISNKISKIVDDYFQNRLFDEDISLLTPIRA